MTDPGAHTHPDDASRSRLVQGSALDKDRVMAESAADVYVYRLAREDGIEAVTRLGGLDADAHAALSNLGTGQFLLLRRTRLQVHVALEAPHAS